MKRLTTLPSFLAASTLAVAMSLGAGNVSAQPASIETVEGQVQERFGNDFVVEANGERILVRNPSHAPLNLEQGDVVTISGRRGEGSIHAREILQSDGTRIVGFAPRPMTSPHQGPRHQGFGYQADMSHLEEQLGERGFGQILHAEPKGSHLRVHTNASNGMPVEVRFEHDGSFREWRIKRPGNTRPRLGEWGSVPMQEISQLVQQQGYDAPRIIDTKGRHLEVLAQNSRGEAVELHVDYAGQVYREKRHYTSGFFN
ncbi:hypothetical protein LCGC14_0072920 [marine sediment metagenome]|uniref:Uncharacterized protein n=1 Tax=marine sediment metagenome TaxID=412755 RepID=A0A0F9Y1B9_9ZZZZ|nr:hypothetical protein [Halomonas sp.]HDZ48939.1 hypothetical protein [Halomonas sp.]HEB06317.1 hypothetical protein [Halomonas sp.]